MGLISKKAKTSAGKLFGVNNIYGAEDGKETVYMTRVWFGRLRFHIFFRGDQDPDCHDHPWGFWTFPLRSYVEEVLEERVETRWVPDRPVLAGYDADGDPIWLEHLTVNGGTEEIVRRYFERHTEIVRAFRWHYRPATYRHRVLGAWDRHYEGWAKRGHHYNVKGEIVPAHIPGGIVPTIVWRDKPSRAWGFTKERSGIWCWVPWKDYVFNGGKAAPCQDEIE